jgi:hypothetical protein
MRISMLNGLASRAVVAAATLLVSCSGSSGSGAPATSGPVGGASSEGAGTSPTEAATPSGSPATLAVLDAIYGDWHEDNNASTEDRAVFVPRSVPLGAAMFRRTLSFGRDGSFSTLRLDPADAHYECKGTFAAVAPDKLEAKCPDPKTREEIHFAIRIHEASKARLVLQIKP